MKKLLLLVVAILVYGSIKAQNYDALNTYMKNYVQCWCRDGQVGTPMPAYYFDKELNNKTLKGKFVVLNFWATWCGGCRLLSMDLDSINKKDPEAFKGVQLIGVDSQEKMINKGYEAAKWWKEKNIGFPTVGGKVADACDALVKAGHPTVILIDGNGFIRGRWDSWTPTTAQNVQLAVWDLYTVPTNKIEPNTITINKYLDKYAWDKALYLTELLPESLQKDTLKYKSLMHVSDYGAQEFMSKLKNKYDQSIDKYKVMQAIVNATLESKTTDIILLKIGIDAMYLVLNSGKGNNYAFIQKEAMLIWGYGQAMKKRGLGELNASIECAKEQKVDECIIQGLKKTFDEYKIAFDKVNDNEEDDAIHNKMNAAEADEQIHIKAKK
jgi:thiol-disulfide isomerase/thioredoxin